MSTSNTTVLVDSNVFIKLWKSPSDEIKDKFKDIQAAVCGVIVAELLHGAVSDKNLDYLKNLLGAFKWLSIEESDWNGIGTLLYKLRTKGITVPFPDAVIAYVGVKNDVPVWSNDKHFASIQQVEPKLKLY